MRTGASFSRGEDRAWLKPTEEEAAWQGPAGRQLKKQHSKARLWSLAGGLRSALAESLRSWRTSADLAVNQEAAAMATGTILLLSVVVAMETGGFSRPPRLQRKEAVDTWVLSN
ncbi:hypothetical protein MHYP_G00342220 [Metynnis hypsauchen]